MLNFWGLVYKIYGETIRLSRKLPVGERGNRDVLPCHLSVRVAVQRAANGTFARQYGMTLELSDVAVGTAHTALATNSSGWRCYTIHFAVKTEWSSTRQLNCSYN
jgi:hypothetical protein